MNSETNKAFRNPPVSSTLSLEGSTSDIKKLFKACDLDGSGDIDRNELSQICPNLTEQEIDSVFNDLDADNDGRISFYEFSQGFKELLPQSDNNRKEGDEVEICLKIDSKASTENKDKHNNNNNKRVESVDCLFQNLDSSFKSLNSQDLVCDFYQTLSQQEHPENVLIFEKILYSIIDDVQKYQKEIQRLEHSYKREKEQNEKFLKQIEEEAEHQLSIATEKIKNEEKSKWEQEREQLKASFRKEIAELQSNLKQMEKIEQTYISSKNDEGSQVSSLKSELSDVIVENRQLKSTVTESQTQLAVLRSEMATLKSQYEDKKHDYENEKRASHDLYKEVDNLKHQIRILHEANKRLHDANDDLRAHVETVKVKALRIQEQSAFKPVMTASSPFSRKDSTLSPYMLNENSKNYSQNKNKFFQGIAISGSKYNMTNTSFDAESITEDIDSGFSTINGVTEGETDVENLNLALQQTKHKNVRNPNNTDNLASDTDEVFDNENMENSYKHKNLRNRNNRNVSPTPSTGSSKKLKRQQQVNDVPDISLPKSPTGPPDRMFKVVFAGDAAVGKSSFIMRFCKGKFISNLNSTLGVDFQMKLMDVDGKTTALQLWDTCGQERFRAIAKSYFRRADGVVLMYDCTYERSYLSVREWIATIQESTDKKIPVILVANKTDLRNHARDDGKKVVEYEDGFKLAKEYDAMFIESSAKDGNNVYESFIEIARAMRCNEDIEVKAVGIKLNWDDKKKTCCWAN